MLSSGGSRHSLTSSTSGRLQGGIDGVENMFEFGEQDPRQDRAQTRFEHPIPRKRARHTNSSNDGNDGSSNNGIQPSSVVGNIQDQFRSNTDFSSSRMRAAGASTRSQLQNQMQYQLRELRRRQERGHHRLYIVVFNIEGPYLSSPEAQLALSLLAASPMISIIATCEHLNTPLLWDHEHLSRFRWTYSHAPTYECTNLPEGYNLVNGESGTGNSKSGTAASSRYSSAEGQEALKYLLKSMNYHQREMLGYLAKLELQRKKLIAKDSGATGAPDGSGEDLSLPFTFNSKGVFENDLYRICRDKLLVNDRENMKRFLREMKEHKLISLSISRSGKGGRHGRDEEIDSHILPSSSSDGLQLITSLLDVAILEVLSVKSS